jgi:hypothetical protein
LQGPEIAPLNSGDFPINLVGGYRTNVSRLEPDLRQHILDTEIPCGRWGRFNPAQSNEIVGNFRIAFKSNNPWSDDLDVPAFLRRRP